MRETKTKRRFRFGTTPWFILGAVIIISIPELLRFLDLPGHVTGALKQMIFSTLLILLMLFRSGGILGKGKSRVERFKEEDGDIKD